MGAPERLITLGFKMLGKAIKSKPAQDLGNSIGKTLNNNTVKKVTDSLDKATGRVFSKLLDRDLENAKRALEAMLNNMNDRFFNNNIGKNDLFGGRCNLPQLMDFLEKDDTAYKIKLRFLILQYLKIWHTYSCSWELEQEKENQIKKLENKQIFKENEDLATFKKEYYLMKERTQEYLINDGIHKIESTFSEKYELELKKLLHKETKIVYNFVCALIDFKKLEKYE